MLTAKGLRKGDSRHPGTKCPRAQSAANLAHLAPGASSGRFEKEVVVRGIKKSDKLQNE
jgi:hypothetical protein